MGCKGWKENTGEGSPSDYSIISQSPADSLLRFPESWPDSFGYGRIVSVEEIGEWDIDVMPDGTGLPVGTGTVAEGRVIYQNICVTCHGVTGVEVPFDNLVGREPRIDFPFGKDYKYLSMRTIGNYWPYATTLFDYIRRAMPQNEPGSLGANEVYALSAYLLHLNEIVSSDAVMDKKTLPAIKMPARDRFVMDNRAGGREIK
ncbi:MAG: c-type cytochrome [Saprospiraceae bacterium]|nr:c-type cytochrome [Saprospiraceae bacterium]